VGYNQDMAREFIDDCAFWARAYELAASEIGEALFEGEGLEEKDILVYRIKFASGHEIVALSSRPANLRGKQGRVVIDKAAIHPDRPGLLRAALLTGTTSFREPDVIQESSSTIHYAPPSEFSSLRGARLQVALVRVY
jgi:phage FluMu gp28-like protein